jgi:hypothetical protein
VVNSTSAKKSTTAHLPLGHALRGGVHPKSALHAALDQLGGQSDDRGHVGGGGAGGAGQGGGEGDEVVDLYVFVGGFDV